MDVQHTICALDALSTRDWSTTEGIWVEGYCMAIEDSIALLRQLDPTPPDFVQINDGMYVRVGAIWCLQPLDNDAILVFITGEDEPFTVGAKYARPLLSLIRRTESAL